MPPFEIIVAILCGFLVLCHNFRRQKELKKCHHDIFVLELTHFDQHISFVRYCVNCGFTQPTCTPAEIRQFLYAWPK